MAFAGIVLLFRGGVGLARREGVLPRLFAIGGHTATAGFFCFDSGNGWGSNGEADRHASFFLRFNNGVMVDIGSILGSCLVGQSGAKGVIGDGLDGRKEGNFICVGV